jgi:hypothetical protein
VTGDPTRELIRELASDLAPVRPLPRLRFLAAVVLWSWLAIGAAGVALQGLAPTFWRSLAAPLSSGGIFAGLLGAGLGGALAALALAIPGRERVARVGLALGGGGAALAAGIACALLARSSLAAWRAPAAGDLPCLATALAIGLVPALALGWLAGRAAPHRPLTIALAAAAGAAALGGSVAQATCAWGEAMHLLLGHALVPAVGALALTLPLLVAIRRSEREHAR